MFDTVKTNSPWVRALSRPSPRWSRITVNVSLVAIVPLLVWVAFAAEDVPGWHMPLWYTFVGLLFLSFMLSLAEESWTRVGAAVTRALSTILAIGVYLTLVADAELPWWAMSMLYVGLAVMVIAAVAGKIIAYREGLETAGVPG